MKTKKKEKEFYYGKEEEIFKEIFLKEQNKDLLSSVIEASIKKNCGKINPYHIKWEEFHKWMENISSGMLLKTDIGIIEIRENPDDTKKTREKSLILFFDNWYRIEEKRSITNTYQYIQLNFSWGMIDEKDFRDITLRAEENICVNENAFIRKMNMEKLIGYWRDKNAEKISEYKYIIMLGLDWEELKELYSYTKDDLIKKYIKELKILGEDKKK